MNRIRKGDQVIVITGKYKGQKQKWIALEFLGELDRALAVSHV